MACKALKFTLPAPDTNAILLLDITYVNHLGHTVHVKSGTNIRVDAEFEIALIGDDHVDVAEWEYVLLDN